MIGADDLALIMDFGISASTDEAAEHDIVGTLEYMAPEQGKGDGVDQRSDIYAFGLILYEMLAGPRRGYATTPQERVDAMRERTSKGVAPLRSQDATIPEPLSALVTRCIELDAAMRFQTTAELCASLARLDENGELIPEPTKISRRMLLAAACLVMIALIATGWIVRWLTPASPAQHAPVTVVLSEFENRTGDPVFDGSLEPLLVRDLERVSFINPITRTDDAVRNDPVLAGGRLDEQKSRLVAIRNGYPYVLSGRIDRAGSGYELTLRIVDPPADGKVLKTVSKKVGSKEDVIKTLPSLAAAVRAQLGDTVKRDESATSETLPAGSLEAVRAYTAANQLAAQAKDAEAIVQYQRAVQLDPQLGRAYSGWALSAAKLGRTDEADELWKKALALLDRMTERERYRTLGNYYSRVVRNPEKHCVRHRRILRMRLTCRLCRA